MTREEITREEAVERLEEATPYVADGIREALYMAIEALQAELVKHGEWEYGEGRQEGWLVCCECGGAFDVIKRKENIHYCPNCGAKMDKEIEDNGTE